MITLDLDTTQLRQALRELRSDRFLNEAVNRALAVVALQMMRDVYRHTPRGEGGLLKSWRVEKNGNQIELGYDIIYAAYQNKGMREDGTYVIVNRPAGGKTGFFSDTIDENLQSYFNMFEDEIMNYINTKL